jgi:cysteinyl-tRNA synthetase
VKASLGSYRAALELLGLSPDESWLEEPRADLASDVVERLSALLGEEISFNGATAPEAVERVIAARTAARENKNWSASDRLRDALLQVGVELMDTKNGTSWRVAP